jgi:hypothetical protein
VRFAWGQFYCFRIDHQAGKKEHEAIRHVRGFCPDFGSPRQLSGQKISYQIFLIFSSILLMSFLLIFKGIRECCAFLSRKNGHKD